MLRSWLPPTSHDEGKSATTAKKDRIRVILEDEKDPDGNMIDVSVVLRFVGVRSVPFRSVPFRSVPLRCLCLGRRSCRRLFFSFACSETTNAVLPLILASCCQSSRRTIPSRKEKKTRTKSKYIQEAENDEF